LSTPACTATPLPKTQWEIQYGEAIARAAHGLLGNADNYYIWGAHDGEDYHVPPPRHPPEQGDIWWNYGEEIDIYERTGGRTPIVCADIISISYAQAGLDLEKTYPDWNTGGARGKNSTSSRDVFMLGVLLRDHHQEHHWDEEGGKAIELGDMVLKRDYSHSAVVAEIYGNDSSQIFVVQASYSRDAIQKWSLAEWGTAGIHYGHPWP